MRYTVHKVYFVWQYEKEEKWINEMAAKGLNLVSVGFCRYEFEEGTPGEYNYHLEYLKKLPSNPESISYIHFLEDTGVEHVGTFKKWAYFRKKASEGEFDLYSDIDSQLNHLKRIYKLLLFLLPLEILAILFNLYPSISFHSIINIICAVVLSLLTLFLLLGLMNISSKIKSLKRKRIISE